MTPIRFTKMHGIGNDYIYINACAERVEQPQTLATVMADRHFGIGADGLILICPPSNPALADVRMRMFNADGSESEMCGNGVRCVCKFAHDRGLTKANPMRIETGRGVLTLQYTLDALGAVDQVTVDMGQPILDPPAIPVDIRHLAAWSAEQHVGQVRVDDVVWTAVFVSMGNPHAVVFASQNPRMMHAGLRALDVARWGPLIEQHPAFPRRINVHWVDVHSPSEVTMCTWERGTGITLACGTGASAVCVAGALLGFTDRDMLAHLPGGDLRLRWDQRSNHVFKTGPATFVFDGTWMDRP